jgi:hypothetical protein
MLHTCDIPIPKSEETINDPSAPFSLQWQKKIEENLIKISTKDGKSTQKNRRNINSLLILDKNSFISSTLDFPT